MKFKKMLPILLVYIVLLSACASQLKIVSKPDKANIYILGSKLTKEKKIGVSPLVLEAKDLKESLSGVGQPGELITLRVTLEDYKDYQIMLPLNSASVLTGEINLILEKNIKKNLEISTAREILEQMFLAQKFARLKQFERALIEIDKVIQAAPKLARALSMKASIYYAQGLFKESLTWYEKTIEIDKQMGSAIEMVAKVRKRLRSPAGTTK